MRRNYESARPLAKVNSLLKCFDHGWRKACRTMLIAAISPCSMVTAVVAAELPEPAILPNYITVKDGHLSRSNIRLRIWGVNLQSGVFKSYEEIDRLIIRLKALGFNAIRVWPTSGTFYQPSNGPQRKPVLARAGDASDLDRFDYLIARAAAAGIVVQMTMLHYMDLPMLRTLSGSPLADLIRTAHDEKDLRALHGFAPYVSTVYRDALKEHIARLLAHVNPYTGRAYADEPAISTWELANEARFVECALSASCLRQLPASMRDDLIRLWNASPRNSARIPLPSDLDAFFAPGNYAAYSRFVIDHFLLISQELQTFARSRGPAGKGIAIQPFIFNTGPVGNSAAAHYAYSRADVLSIGIYSSPLQRNGLDGTPWMPVSMGGPVPPMMLNMKVVGKPLIVYETSFFRPYPYRAEWGPIMLAAALQQDWDGAFLYQYGHPSIIYTYQGRPEGYGRMALAQPLARELGGDYTYGFHHGSDPIIMGSWSAAGLLFTAIHESPPLQYKWQIPLDHILKHPTGYPERSMAQIQALAKTASVSVEFVLDTNSECRPCKISNVLPATFDVLWRNERQALEIRTANGIVLSRTFENNASGQMLNGLQWVTRNGGFAVVAQVAVENQGGVRQPSILTVLGDVTNTGTIMNLDLTDYTGPTGAMAAVRKKGSSPLSYVSPDFTFNKEKSLIKLTDADYGLQLSTPRTMRSIELGKNSSVFRAIVEVLPE